MTHQLRYLQPVDQIVVLNGVLKKILLIESLVSNHQSWITLCLKLHF